MSHDRSPGYQLSARAFCYLPAGAMTANGVQAVMQAPGCGAAGCLLLRSGLVGLHIAQSLLNGGAICLF